MENTSSECLINIQMSAISLQIPELSKVYKNVTKQVTNTPDAIQRLLHPLDILIFENHENSSDHSELLDEHQDLYKEDCRLKSYKDHSILEYFTEDYKNTAREIRDELQVGTSKKCDKFINKSIADI